MVNIWFRTLMSETLSSFIFKGPLCDIYIIWHQAEQEKNNKTGFS